MVSPSCAAATADARVWKSNPLPVPTVRMAMGAPLECEGPLQGKRAVGECGVVQAVAEAGDVVGLHGDLDGFQDGFGFVGAVDGNDVVRLAMDQGDRGWVGQLLG